VTPHVLPASSVASPDARDGNIASPSAGASPPKPPRPAADTRIDVLSGDRCCASCGFNLFGQTIIREPHYGLIMVRCPECGHAAALQEYPTLARMTGRLRSTMAASWVAAILAGFAITGGLIYGFSTTTTDAVVAPYSRVINFAWQEWAKANQTAAQQTAWWGNQNQMQTWWEGLPPAKFFAEFGSWTALNWRGLITWAMTAIVIFPIGVIWAVAFARLRGFRLLLVLMLPVLFAISLAAYNLVDANGGWYYTFDTAIESQVGWVPTGLSIVAGALFLFAGALMGRPIARAFLRHVLPARLLAAFAFLWMADGKGMPKP